MVENSKLTEEDKARSTIIACVSDKHIENIRNAKTSYQMIKCFENVFARKSVMSKLYLKRKSIQLKCDEITRLQEHFVKFDEIISELEAIGTKMDEENKVCHLLLSMPPKFDVVITVLEKSNQTLTIEFVKSKLLDAELKINNADSGTPSAEFSLGTKVRRCFNCGSTKHLKDTCPQNRNNGSHNFQHRGGNYPSRGSYQRRRGGNTNYLAESRMEDDYINFIALSTEIDEEKENKGECINFILDSGASYNLFRGDMVELMSEVKSIEPIPIKIANGSNIFARNEGIIRVCCYKTGMKLNINGLIVDNLLGLSF